MSSRMPCTVSAAAATITITISMMLPMAGVRQLRVVNISTLAVLPADAHAVATMPLSNVVVGPATVVLFTTTCVYALAIAATLSEQNCCRHRISQHQRIVGRVHGAGRCRHVHPPNMPLSELPPGATRAPAASNAWFCTSVCSVSLAKSVSFAVASRMPVWKSWASLLNCDA